MSVAVMSLPGCAISTGSATLIGAFAGSVASSVSDSAEIKRFIVVSALTITTIKGPRGHTVRDKSVAYTQVIVTFLVVR